MNTEQALETLRKHLDEIPGVIESGLESPAHVRWLQNVSFELGRIFGGSSGPFESFMQLTFRRSSQILAGVMPWNIEAAVKQGDEEEFRRQMGIAQGILDSAIDQLEKHGLEQLRKDTKYLVANDAKKVFVTHGHADDVLRRIEDFIRAFGLEPIVVKRGPSKGMAVDDLVETRMAECETQIVLATADDEQADGTFRPRPNVIHEIGLGQRIFGDKIVYLKEQGCDFPSNVAPKVWESFTRDDLAPAFEKITKELKAFALF